MSEPRFANKDEIELLKIFNEVARQIFPTVFALMTMTGVLFRVFDFERYHGITVFSITIDRVGGWRVDLILLTVAMILTAILLVLGHKMYSTSFAAMATKMTEEQRDSAINALRQSDYSAFSIFAGMTIFVWYAAMLFKIFS